jgi:hypothetical protein
MTIPSFMSLRLSRPHQVLLVSVLAGYRRFRHLYGIEAGGPKTELDLVNRCLAKSSISDDTPSDQVLSDLELGLDKDNQIGPRLRQSSQGRRHRTEGDESQVGHNQVELASEACWRGSPNVEPFEDRDTPIAAKFRSQLIPTYIHGYDLGGPPLQETVGKPPGGGTGIDDSFAIDLDSKSFERKRQFFSRAAGEPLSSRQLDRAFRRHRTCGLGALDSAD